jgi:hypothetical protein
LGDAETLVFQLELTAERPGLLTFQSEAADELPRHDVLLYNVNFEIPTDWVDYGEASVVVVERTVEEPIEAAFQNRQQPQDVNADGIVAPGDLLLVVNDLNQIGARSLTAFASPPALLASELRQSEGESARPYFPDVNGDQYVSAADALVIINWLNDPTTRPVSNAPGTPSAVLGAATTGQGESPLVLAADRTSSAPTAMGGGGVAPYMPSPPGGPSVQSVGHPVQFPANEENLGPAGPLAWSELESLLAELAAGVSAAKAGS